MEKLKYIKIILLIAICGCSAETEVKEYYANGNLKAVRQLKDKQIHGESKFFNEDGGLKAIETWKEGKLHGTSKMFYESGKLRLQLEFMNGEAIKSSVKRFHDNGKTLSEYLDSYPILLIYSNDGIVEEKHLLNSADSVIDFVKLSKSGEVIYAPSKTAFIDFSTDSITIGNDYKIVLNRDHDKWRSNYLIISTNLNNAIISKDTLPPIDDDLGYYSFTFEPKEKGKYDFDLYFYDKNSLDTAYIYRKNLIVN